MPHHDCLNRLRAWYQSDLPGPVTTVIHDAATGRPATDDNVAAHDLHGKIMVYTCRLPYEPSWGGRGGLPRPLLLEKELAAGDETTSHAIAPFLRLYRSAGRRILLERDQDETVRVLLPDDLVTATALPGTIQLLLHRDKIVAIGPDGRPAALRRTGPFLEYTAATALVDALNERRFEWFGSHPTPIGAFLTSDLFTFSGSLPESSGSPFLSILQPLMPGIVADQTPHLRAAELYLQAFFDTQLHHFSRTSVNRIDYLLVAALLIDMSGFTPDSEPFLVPWQAVRLLSGTAEPMHISQEEIHTALATQPN